MATHHNTDIIVDFLLHIKLFIEFTEKNIPEDITENAANQQSKNRNKMFSDYKFDNIEGE